MVGDQVPTAGRVKRSLTGALAREPRWDTRPAVNRALVAPSAVSVAALTVAKSAGGSATWRFIAVQSRACQAVRKALSVACGVEGEPPHPTRPSAVTTSSPAAVSRDFQRGGNTRARIYIA